MNDSKRILVTGSQGFLGRHVTAEILRRIPAAQVTGVGRQVEERRFWPQAMVLGERTVRFRLPRELEEAAAHPRYRYAAQDLTDRPGLMRLLQDTQPRIIVHLAAALCQDPPDELFAVNVGAVNHLFEAVVGAGIPTPRILLCSSAAVYGEVAPDRLPTTETTATRPITHYGVSKEAAESVGRILARRHGIDVVTARLFNLLGPGQDERHAFGRLSRLCAAMHQGIYPRSLEIAPFRTSRDFIDVRDAARAVVQIALEGSSSEMYNVASQVEVATRDVFEEIGRQALSDGDWKVTLPPRPVDIERQCGDTGKLTALGWRPRIPWRQSITEMLAEARNALEVVSTDPTSSPPTDATGSKVVRLAVRQRHEYDVEVAAGLLKELPEILAHRFPNRRMVVLSDERVAGICARSLQSRLEARGVPSGLVRIPEGEKAKNLSVFETLLAELHRQRFDRRSLLVSVGGGTILDVGGYAAASYMRGVEYVNVPTTLLAQHDASVGGKVAVNAPWSKNFIGAFHHPAAVYADPQVLATLDARQMRAGVAESIKVAMTGDRTLFEILEREPERVIERPDPAILETVVRRSIRRKVELLRPDPLEVDLRRALNLGHTFAHPLETEFAYEGILHGEAVAMGLALATAVAVRNSVCPPEDAERIFALLAAYDLPPRLPEDRLFAALDHLDTVRLIRGCSLHFVLPAGIDRVTIVPEVGRDALEEGLRHALDHPLLRKPLRMTAP